MYQPPNETGTPTRVTTSGVAVLASANLALIGLVVGTVITAQFVQIWSGSSTGVPVIGTMTCLANTFYRIPAYCRLGLTYCVTNDDVDLTLFWNPVGT